MAQKLMTPDEFAQKLRELARTAHTRPVLNYESLLVELEAGYRAALAERASTTATRVDTASRAAAREAIAQARAALWEAETLMVSVDAHSPNRVDWSDLYGQRDYFESRLADLVTACVRATKAQLASGATTSEPATENAWEAQVVVDEAVIELERLFGDALFGRPSTPGGA